jgi:SulP family sulfate permease
MFATRASTGKGIATPPLVDVVSLGSLSTDDGLVDDQADDDNSSDFRLFFGASLRESISKTKASPMNTLEKIFSQIPAVAIVSVLNFMVGIPFGASYFPVEWGSSTSTLHDFSVESDAVDAAADFPLPGKEALGLRMFLFSTIMAQLAFTFTSKFTNGVGLQMVENVPFCLELAHIVIREQGYGMDALSTLCFLFGFSSVIVGAVFYMLGKFNLGRIVYFFPSHILVGCIGGIGAFIITTCEFV